MKRIIFADPTPLWVPPATILLISGFTWGSLWWGFMSAADAFKLSAGVAVVLAVLMAFQGWLYWKTDIAQVSVEGDEVEARIVRWLGPAPRLRFKLGEAVDWRVISYSGQRENSRGKPNLGFTLRGREYRMPLFSAKLIDFDGLRLLDPAFFDRLLSSQPELAATAPAAA